MKNINPNFNKILMFGLLFIIFIFQVFVSSRSRSIYAVNAESSSSLASAGQTGTGDSGPTLTPTGTGGSGPTLTPTGIGNSGPTPTGIGGTTPTLTPSPTISIGPSFPTPTVTFTPTNTPTPTPDIQAPVVAITYPSNGSFVNKNTTINITATATDNVAIASVKFSVNGVLLCTDVSAPYSCAWSVPKKANIVYTLSAQATDTSGNSSTTAITVRSR